ncbi:MAG: hypothetical protein SCK70_05060, partial [bacterium]|nr:hypothetical protein [bacterium]
QPNIYRSKLSVDSLEVDSLDYDAEYFWKVVVYDQSSTSASSPVWSFRTRYEHNAPPFTPSQPIPADNQSSVAIKNVELKWQGGDPDHFSVVKYDVYFGNDPQSLALVARENSDSRFQPPLLLDYQTDYFWQIIAVDSYDSVTVGPVWRFQTVTPDSLFGDNFDDYNVNENPSILKWSLMESNATIRISDEASWKGTGKSVCFIDTTVADSSFLAARFPPKSLGMVQFYWMVTAETDFFGMRLYSQEADTSHLGPQISLRAGVMQFYDQNRIWQTIIPVQINEWYKLKLVFDCEDRIFNIYVNDELKVAAASWSGSMTPFFEYIYFLTFSNQTCQKAFLDEFVYKSDQ